MIGPRAGAPSLLPRQAAGDRWLAAVIAVLCFLASLAALGAVSADRAAHGWARELRSEATVLVRPRAGETGTTAAARAAETLAGVDGVAEAAALDREAAEGLLRPWVGEAVLGDLPVPHLVAVRLDPAAPASAPTLSRALAEAGLDASVDDHSLWRGEVERAAALITALAVAAFLLTAFAAGAAIAWAVAAGFQAARGVIETLSLNGATDRRLAGLFARRYALLTLGAGAAGTAAAAATAAGLRWLGGSEGLTPALPIAWADLAILSPGPLVAATVALVAAWLAAKRALSHVAFGRVGSRKDR